MNQRIQNTFYKLVINISMWFFLSEFKSISELKKLLAADCKIEKIEPPV